MWPGKFTGVDRPLLLWEMPDNTLGSGASGPIFPRSESCAVTATAVIGLEIDPRRKRVEDVGGSIVFQVRHAKARGPHGFAVPNYAAPMPWTLLAA